MCIIKILDYALITVSCQNKAKNLIQKHGLLTNTNVYFSPVHESLSADKIVDYMIEHNLTGVRLQLQLHKFIWDPNMRGV